MGIIPGRVAEALTPGSSSNRKPGLPVADTAEAGEGDPDVDDKVGELSDEEDGRQDGDLGFDVRFMAGELVVNRVEDDGPAGRTGVRTGWILKKINRLTLAEVLEEIPSDVEPRQKQFMAWRLAQANLRGAPGSRAKVEFLDAAGEPREFKLRRWLIPGETVHFGLLPPVQASLQQRRIETAAGATVGLIRFNIWMIPIARPFDQAVDDFRTADGIVLDLRGNLGGIGGMILGLSGHFLNQRLSLGTMKTRENDLKFLANPRRVNPAGQRVEPYRGPLAIVVDEISLSAAEIFAGGLQDLGRARIFGSPSGGQALPAVWDRLPNGDILYHAFADFILPSGQRLEGRGVIPDQNVPLTRENLLAGRDAAMEAALSWIERQKKERGAVANESVPCPEKQ